MAIWARVCAHDCLTIEQICSYSKCRSFGMVTCGLCDATLWPDTKRTNVNVIIRDAITGPSLALLGSNLVASGRTVRSLCYPCECMSACVATPTG